MPRRIALIVGVSQYEPHTQLGNLSAPVNDAQRVYEVLSTYGGFDMLYPLPLADGKVGSSGKVNAHTLREELRKILNPQASAEVELAVFYFSGHGVSHHGMASYLSATDDPLAVPLSFIIELVENSAVKNVCVWLDCCHSGEVLKFKTSEKKSFCIVAASTADEEALARKGQSLLTEILCEALTPDQDRPEIRVLEFVDYLEAHRKNLPQQILFRGDTPFTLTQYHGEVSVKSPYPPEHPPYKGLLTFTQADREFFFGRDGMIQQLLDRLSASRFVPLLGASGSGKSSLVLAGLLPQLPESHWQVLVMRPTAQPLQNVRDTLVRGFPDAQVGAVATGTDLQREVLKLVTAGKRLLLVVDQFEEVFTECRDDAARATFIACLLEALDGDNPLHLVLTLRADFLGHCTEQAYAGLGQRLQHHALLLVAPTAGELREAITRPLTLVGMRCEQALEDELVDQTLHAKGSLPLLQYVLEKLWQSARQELSRELTLAMYQQLGGQHGGGLRGVLNEKADAFYQQLEPQQQRLMEWLMVELVQVNDGQEDTRRTVTLQELHHRQPQYTEALDALLAQLVTHERLLTQDHDDQEQATVTVAHEALIRDWQRLRGWLENSHEIKSWRLRLEDSITAWKNNVSGSLLREKLLVEAQQVIDRNPGSLLIGQNEKAFITASQAEAKRHRRLRLGSLLAFIGVLLVGIAATTWQWKEANQQKNLAEKRTHEAKQQAEIALINKLMAQSNAAMVDPTATNGDMKQGLLLAVESFQLNKAFVLGRSQLLSSLNNIGYLSKVLYGHTWSVNKVTFSPSGMIVASGGDDGSIIAWNSITGDKIGESFIGYKDSADEIAFSPSENLLASIGDLGKIKVWDMRNHKEIYGSWNKYSNFVIDVKFLDDDHIIVGGITEWYIQKISSGEIKKIWVKDEKKVERIQIISDDGKFAITSNELSDLRVWSLESGKPVTQMLTGHKGATITGLAFSKDNKMFASSGADGELRLWDISSGRLLWTVSVGNERQIHSIAFSPDSKIILSGSVDNTIQCWNSNSGQQIGQPWKGHTSTVSSIAFSPDGDSIVSGSWDHSLHFWNFQNKMTALTLTGNKKEVTSVSFSSSENKVASADVGGEITLWDLTNNSYKLLHGHKDKVSGIRFSPDGKKLVSVGFDGLIILWDVYSGNKIWERDVEQVYNPNQNPNLTENIFGFLRSHIMHSVAYNFDGSLISSTNSNGDIFIQSAPSGELLKKWHGHDGFATSTVFSRNNLLITGGQYGDVKIWDVATGKLIASLAPKHKGRITSISISHDNRLIVTGSEDHTIKLWDLDKKRQVGKSWEEHEWEIQSLEFDSSDKVVASSGWDIILWDVTSKKPIGLLSRNNPISSLDFNIDGKKIISGDINGVLKLWDADPESWAKKACSIVNRNFSLAEWQRFIGDALPYQKTCPDLPAPGEEGWVEPYAGE